MTEDKLLNQARQIATDVLKTYGEFDDAGWHRFTNEGIWNDHPAVQAALAALKSNSLPENITGMTEAEALEKARFIGQRINGSGTSLVTDVGEAIIATALREAVAAETERCAEVARAYPGHVHACIAIAAAIRNSTND